MLVLVEDDEIVDIAYRDDGTGKASLLPGLSGASLRLHRVSVDIGAREAVFGGDQVCGDALRHEPGRHRTGGIERPGATRCHHADTRHAFDAAGDDEILLTTGNLAGR
jgi:hypothetical protein